MPANNSYVSDKAESPCLRGIVPNERWSIAKSCQVLKNKQQVQFRTGLVSFIFLLIKIIKANASLNLSFAAFTDFTIIAYAPPFKEHYYKRWKFEEVDS